MTEDYGASVNDWMNVVRRAALDTDTKLVAFLVASYADPDGTSIYPGVAKLAVQAGLSYRTVQRCMARLRTLQLIERMPRSGKRRGWSVAYRLTLGPELLDKVDVMTPAAEIRAVESIASRERERMRTHRAKHRKVPVDNSPQDATTIRQLGGVSSGDDTPEPRRGRYAKPNSLTSDDAPLTLHVPLPVSNPPSDDGQVSIPRTGSWGPLEADDDTPDTRTRNGTAQAAMAAADKLNAWMRDHPDAVVVNSALWERWSEVLGPDLGACYGTADDFRDLADLLDEAAP